MSSFRKRIIWILLTTFIFTLFVGFTVQGEETTGESVKLKWVLIGAPPKDFDQVAKKLNERLSPKTGANVEFIFLDWMDFTARKKLMFAAGEPIDLIYSAGWWDYRKEAAGGYYYGIKELLDKYASKTKALLGISILKGAEVGGELYALPVPGQAAAHSGGMLFRNDLVKKYKIDLSKIKKLADVEPALKLIKSKQPSIMPMVNTAEGLDTDITGFSIVGDDSSIPGVISTINKDTKIINEFAHADTMAFFKTLSKFSKSGYVKKKTGMYTVVDGSKTFSQLVKNANQLSGGFNEGYDWTFINLGNSYIDNLSAIGSMNSVCYASKYPFQALSLMEYIYNDAYSSSILHFGVEGKHYVKTSGNVIDYPKGASASKPVYQQSLNWMIGNRYLDFTWKNEDPYKYNKLKTINKTAIVSIATGFVFDAAPVGNEVVKCQAQIDKYLGKLLTGEYDPEKYLPTLNTALKSAGVEKVIAEKQKQFDLWQEMEGNY